MEWCSTEFQTTQLNRRSLHQSSSIGLSGTFRKNSNLLRGNALVSCYRRSSKRLPFSLLSSYFFLSLFLFFSSSSCRYCIIDMWKSRLLRQADQKAISGCPKPRFESERFCNSEMAHWSVLFQMISRKGRKLQYAWKHLPVRLSQMRVILKGNS